jgi:hypothetical protein
MAGGYSLFDIYPPLVDSLFKVTFFDQTGRIGSQRMS